MNGTPPAISAPLRPSVLAMLGQSTVCPPRLRCKGGRRWDRQGCACLRERIPDRRRERGRAAGGQFAVAAVATLTRHDQFIDACQPLASLDLVDLGIHPRQELLAR